MLEQTRPPSNDREIVEVAEGLTKKGSPPEDSSLESCKLELSLSLVL